MRAVKLTYGLLFLMGVGITLASALRVASLRSEAAAAPFDVAAVTKVILPSDGEDLFSTIPWETSLWEARVKAAKAGKPLLLWEMDGHPLGCG